MWLALPFSREMQLPPRGAFSAYNVVIQLKVYEWMLQGHYVHGAVAGLRIRDRFQMSTQRERAVAA